MVQPYHFAVFGIRSQDVHSHSSDVFGERHDQFFADWVDRRIGDLSELLAEIVEQQLWAITQYSQWCIVTHGTYGLGTIFGHGLNNFFDIFAGISKDVEHVAIMRYTMCNFSSAFQFVQFDSVGGKPCAIRLGFSQLALQFVIIVDTSFLCVNQQDFSGLKASFFFYVAWLKIHYTYFAGYYHRVIFCNEVACRTETVSVEHTTSISTVAEEQSGRTVPWFHQDGVVFVESFQVFADRILFIERFGYEHGHSMRQTHTGHD